MGTFRYTNPLMINFGAGSVASLGDALAAAGDGPVVVITTKSLLASNALALLQGASERLRTAEVVTVTSHVPIEEIHEIAQRMHSVGAAAVVGFGGGSAIDAAKLCGYVANSLSGADSSLSEFKRLLATASLTPVPIVCVPTTLAVAELYAGAGFTDDRTGQKEGAFDPAMIPDLVIYDPDVSRETPAWLWLATGMRALDHAIETLVSDLVDPISEALACSAVEDLFRTMPEYHADPASAEARLAGFVAGWKSYHFPSAAAKGLGHTIGKAVGARNGIAHGITSSVILPRMVRYYVDQEQTRESIDRLSSLLRLPTDDRYALSDALESLAGSVGLPTRFTAEQLTLEAAREAAEHSATKTGLSADVIYAILLDCREEPA